MGQTRREKALSHQTFEDVALFPPLPQSFRRFAFPGLCGIALLVLILTYSNHFQNQFHFDDSHALENNVYVRDIRSIPLFFKDATTHTSLPTNQTYRPVLMSLFAVAYWLGNGLDPFYFHLLIFIGYLVQCVLIFFVYLYLMNMAKRHPWNRFVALLATGGFGLHTANAETINYITANSDSLSTLCVIAAFAIYFYFPGVRKWYLYLGPIAVGALIKPTAVMFAPLFFIYLLLFQNEGTLSVCSSDARKKWYRSAAQSAPAFVVCLLLYLFVDRMTSDSWIPGGTSRLQYLQTQSFVIVHYVYMFFLPVGLSADTDWKIIPSVFDDRVVVGMVFILMMLKIAYKTSKTQNTRPIAFGILWFFLALGPTSSLIPLAEVLNDHRVFFPYVGLMLAVSTALSQQVIKWEAGTHRAWVYSRLIPLVVVLVIGAHAVGTYHRNKVWRTGESLWYDVTVKSPNNGRGLMNYGLTQMSQGKYERALEYFEQALRITPYYSYLYVNLGVLKAAMERHSEAERHFRDAIQYGPNFPETHYYYAGWLYRQGRTAEAAELAKVAIRLSHAHVGARKLLMDIYFSQQNWAALQELAKETQGLIRDDPTALHYLSLGHP